MIACCPLAQAIVERTLIRGNERTPPVLSVFDGVIPDPTDSGIATQ